MALKAFMIIFLLASFLSFAPRASASYNDVTPYEEAAGYDSVLVDSLAPSPFVAPSPVPVLPPVNTSECPKLCQGRCKVHSRPRQCSRVCVTCCVRCKCVPPGTFGNRERCGKCYTDMTTHGNKPKCP